MQKYQIIFDFDGVILNSHNVKTEAFLEIFKEYGNIKAQQAQRYHLKNIGISRFNKFEYIINKILKDKTINPKYLNKKFQDYCFKKIKSLKINDDLKKFLRKYNKKYDMFISTATPQYDIIKILKEKKIIHLFKKIYGSPKKKYEHINLIKRKSKKRIFIGDSKEDLKACLKTKTFFLLKEHRENKKIFKNKQISKIKNYKNIKNKLEKFFSIVEI